MTNLAHFRFPIADFRFQSKIENRKSTIATVGAAAFVFFAVMTPVAGEQTVDHTAWDALLRRHVNAQGQVDYAAVQQERAALETYLASLAAAQPSAWSKDEQLAFWINAYNACVFKGVLDHFPLTSVKDVKGFFEKLTYRVAGETLALNAIEAKGRALGDWRIHFGVVCASSSCPFLRNEAYVPERVGEQLTDQARRFLADPSRGLRVDGGTLWLSKIFKWYAKDFVPAGSLTAETLIPVVAPYLPTETAQAVRQGKFSVKFLDYDWTLNKQGGDG